MNTVYNFTYETNYSVIPTIIFMRRVFACLLRVHLCISTSFDFHTKTCLKRLCIVYAVIICTVLCTANVRSFDAPQAFPRTVNCVDVHALFVRAMYLNSGGLRYAHPHAPFSTSGEHTGSHGPFLYCSRKAFLRRNNGFVCIVCSCGCVFVCL